MNVLSLTPKRRILIGLTLISLVFTISLFLPFSEHIHINETEGWRKTTYTMLYQTFFVWLFIANYTVIVFAALSNNRTLLMIVTILVAIWSYALYFLFSYAFGWDGQPIHATFGLGYYMSQFVMLVLFFFSFRWERLLKQIQPTKIHVRIFTLLTIAVPMVMGTAIFLTIRHN